MNYCMSLAFKDALVLALEHTGRSLKSVCQEAGVSYEQMKKVKQGKSGSTNVDDAIRLANALGMTLEEMMQDETALVRSEIVDLYNQLSPEERQFLLRSARGLHAPDHAEET